METDGRRMGAEGGGDLRAGDARRLDGVGRRGRRKRRRARRRRQIGGLRSGLRLRRYLRGGGGVEAAERGAQLEGQAAEVSVEAAVARLGGRGGVGNVQVVRGGCEEPARRRDAGDVEGAQGTAPLLGRGAAAERLGEALEGMEAGVLLRALVRSEEAVELPLDVLLLSPYRAGCCGGEAHSAWLQRWLDLRHEAFALIGRYSHCIDCTIASKIRILSCRYILRYCLITTQAGELCYFWLLTFVTGTDHIPPCICHNLTVAR